MTSHKLEEITVTNKPKSLTLRTLNVYSKAGKLVYSQIFHNGLNVIRSDDNSKGKSTICDFIFYLLGGTVEKWSGAAKSCEFVVADFLISDAHITLRRYLPSLELPSPGIEFFWGRLSLATKSMAGWERHPWKRSSQTESFSQVLFRLLEIPSTKTERDSNITMHELLRLMYADQETSPDKIFRDQQFNNAETRQTIAELLLGYDDLQLHELRQELRDLEGRKGKAESALTAIKSILDSAYPELRLSDFSKLELDMVKQLDDLRSAATSALQTTELKKSEINAARKKSEKSLSALSGEYATASSRLNKARKDAVALSEDIQDSQHFVSSLTRKMEALREAQASMAVLGNIHFERCPSCLAEVRSLNAIEENISCLLCHSPLLAGEIATRRLRLQHEVANQIKESKALLVEKEMASQRIRSEIEKLEVNITAIRKHYDSLAQGPSSIDQLLKEIYTKIGYTEKKIEDIQEKRRLSERIEALDNEIAEIKSQIERITFKISSVTALRATRKQQVEELLSSLTLHILHKDIKSDDNVERASAIEFDFLKDRLILDGSITARLSASTTAFMKSAFYCALFLTSLDDDKVRLPRFMLIDSIEDKGIVPERVHNLHKILIEEIAARNGRGQLIITTSIPNDIINTGGIGVGPIYTEKVMTLNFDGVPMATESERTDDPQMKPADPSAPV